MTATAIFGLVFLSLSLVCLGTWPALLKVGSEPRLVLSHFQMKGLTERDMRFVYIDYALSYTMASTMPLILSMLGTKGGDSSPVPLSLVLVSWAIIGGCLLSFGNLSMQWATTVYGSALTTVLAIQSSMTVILGTGINYLLEPEKTSKPEMLLYGVFFFLAAITLATRAHLVYGRRQTERELADEEIELHDENHKSYNSIKHDAMEEGKSQRPYPARPKSPVVALGFTIFGGFCFGFFSPSFNLAVNDPLGFSDGRPLSVPVANLLFSMSFTLTSVVGNILLMHYPPKSAGLDRTTFGFYLSESFTQRRMSLLAGFVCGLGNLFQFQGGSLVGFATADLVQAFPLISTVWDVLIFGEFSNAGNLVVFYLSAMYAAYISGIGLLAWSIS
jgi:glucose uptake protein GlcU